MTLAATAFLSVTTVAAANAALTIVPSWDASVELLPAADRTKFDPINDAINLYNTWYADDITVHITFETVFNGIGSSTTQFTNISYTDWRTKLIADKTTADDTTATKTLPNQATNPVNGAAQVRVSTANQRAIGLPNAETTDSTILLNPASLRTIAL